MAGQWQSFKLASAAVNPFSGANKSSDFSATVADFSLRQIKVLWLQGWAKADSDLLAPTISFVFRPTTNYRRVLLPLPVVCESVHPPGTMRDTLTRSHLQQDRELGPSDTTDTRRERASW